jgi:hypothetical protein
MIVLVCQSASLPTEVFKGNQRKISTEPSVGSWLVEIGCDPVEPLTFACAAPSRGPGIRIHVPLFAASIRTFGGTLSDCPLWVFIPQSENEISEKITKKLLSLHATVIPFFTDPDAAKFPFAGYVRAAAAAESLAKEKTMFLAWMGLDTLIIREPTHFLLGEGKTVGYRPVHHTLIGSRYQEPLDPFWELIYQKCHVTEDKIFPMTPHVDSNTIRPYFNAGHLIVRPEKGVLQRWWEWFNQLYCNPCFKEYYTKDERYAIFMHQAVLTGVILSNTKRQQLQKLPFTYNYPLHLYHESPHDLQPQNINDLITVRYEQPHVFETIPFHNSFKSWLTEQLNSLKSSEKE